MGTLARRGGEIRRVREELTGLFLSGRNPRTLEAYRQDLEDFRAFTGAETRERAAEILLNRSLGEANALAYSYRAELLERGLSPATVNRRLSSIRSLVRFARTLGAVTWTLEVPNVAAEPYRDTRGPGREGFRAMLSLLQEETGRKAARDRALLRLLYDLALRRGEIVRLDLEDVDLDAGTVRVQGKGRTGKEPMTLPDPTRVVLGEWTQVRGVKPGPLFTNFDRAGKGKRLTGRSIARIIEELGERIGLKVRPHGLRHAAITEALDLTRGDVRAVARFSRHRDLRTLTRYDDNRVDLGGEIARMVAGAV